MSQFSYTLISLTTFPAILLNRNLKTHLMFIRKVLQKYKHPCLSVFALVLLCHEHNAEKHTKAQANSLWITVCHERVLGILYCNPPVKRKDLMLCQEVREWELLSLFQGGEKFHYYVCIVFYYNIGDCGHEFARKRSFLQTCIVHSRTLIPIAN